MKIALPLCYGFEVENESNERIFTMASSYLARDYDCKKDRFTVYLTPGLYKEGSVFDTEDFTSQAMEEETQGHLIKKIP